MSKGPHIEGLVEFLPTEAGGRKKPAIASVYRPQFYFAGYDWVAAWEFPDVKQANPGDTVRILFTFLLRPEEAFERIYVGMPFLIREGPNTVAYGRVTMILDALQQDAAASKARVND